MKELANNFIFYMLLHFLFFRNIVRNNSIWDYLVFKKIQVSARKSLYLFNAFQKVLYGITMFGI